MNASFGLVARTKLQLPISTVNSNFHKNILQNVLQGHIVLTLKYNFECPSLISGKTRYRQEI